MPSPPRMLFPNTVVLISTRIEFGLPLVPTVYMNAIILGILARAQSLYPMIICHFIFMGNHLHIIGVVRDPECVAAFMDRIKTEISHALNRLMGRRQRTVWHPGYDCVPILTAADVREKIRYLYINPVKANLVAKIEHYPGLSSWDMYRSGTEHLEAKWIRRPAINKLPSAALSIRDQHIMRQNLLAKATKAHRFTLSPDAWMNVFGITSAEDKERENRTISEMIAESEKNYSEIRSKEGGAVIGADALQRQRIDAEFTPKSFAKRMYCICADVSLRVQYILEIKKRRAEARDVLKRWQMGDLSVAYPVGFFPPRMPRLANLRALHAIMGVSYLLKSAGL